jgi:hypothetical protein
VEDLHHDAGVFLILLPAGLGQIDEAQSAQNQKKQQDQKGFSEERMES